MTKSDNAPELSLLIAAVLREKPIALEGVALLEIDPESLLHLAKLHQVRSLLFEHLSSHTNTSLGSIMDELKGHQIHEAVYNMMSLKKSVDIYQDFLQNGLQVFLMKGALWAWLFYESPSLREFGDIDYFFAHADIEKGLKILEQHGYVIDAYRQFLITESKLNLDYFATDYQLPLEPVHEDIVKSLEVQWNTTYPRFAYTFTWHELMENSIRVDLSGRELEIPRMENQLLLMIIHHAGIEQWGKLKYVADFVRLLRKFSSQLDWAYITRVAKEKGFLRLLLESIGMVKALTGENYFPYLEGTPDSYAHYPNEKFLRDIQYAWGNIQQKPLTKSWQILSFNLKFRDSNSYRLKILFKHLTYMMNVKLLFYKAKWYAKMLSNKS